MSSNSIASSPVEFPQIRNFKIIVLCLHVLLLAIIVFIFLHYDISGQLLVFNDLAPVSSLYAQLRIGWLGLTRELAHAALTIFDGLGGILIVKYGLQRRNLIAKFFSVAIGSQLIFSSLLSFTLIGLVLWGGIWHFISAVVAVAMGGSAMISFTALSLFWQQLKELEKQRDIHLKPQVPLNKP